MRSVRKHSNASDEKKKKQFDAIVRECDAVMRTYLFVLDKINRSDNLIRIMSSEESTSWTRIPMKADYWDLDNPLRMYFDDDSSAFSMMRVPSDSQMKAVFPTDVDDRGRRIIEGIRFFSLDDTHKFGDKSKNTRSPVKLTIPIGLELRAFLINYIFPDNIPGGVGKYKHNPRYKIENDKVTIGIPETSWAEFLSTFPDENLNFSKDNI